MKNIVNALLDQHELSSKMIYIDRRGNDAVFSVVYTRSMREQRSESRRRYMRYFFAQLRAFIFQKYARD